ncbi:MAG: hypothetical protein AAFW70_11320 [Cyanobacteria bacterium J06635_10]
MFLTKESDQLNQRANQINDGLKLASSPFAQPAFVNSESGEAMTQEQVVEYVAKSKIFSTFADPEALAQQNAALQGANLQTLEAISEASEEMTEEDGKMLDQWGEEYKPTPKTGRNMSYNESEHVELLPDGKILHKKMSNYNKTEMSQSIYSMEEFESYLAGTMATEA